MCLPTRLVFLYYRRACTLALAQTTRTRRGKLAFRYILLYNYPRAFLREKCSVINYFRDSNLTEAWHEGIANYNIFLFAFSLLSYYTVYTLHICVDKSSTPWKLQ